MHISTYGIEQHAKRMPLSRNQHADRLQHPPKCCTSTRHLQQLTTATLNPVLDPSTSVCIKLSQKDTHLHKGQVRGILHVEVQGAREALGRRPEGRARGGDGVLGEGVGELRDTVVEVLLEAHAHPADAVLKAGAPAGWQVVVW